MKDLRNQLPKVNFKTKNSIDFFFFKKVKKNEVLAVVTHGGILHFICNILTKQKRNSGSFIIFMKLTNIIKDKYFIHENCAILELEYKNGEFGIKYINFHGHLKNPVENIDLTTPFQDLIKPYDIFEMFFNKK